jgi:hypothetical protein
MKQNTLKDYTVNALLLIAFLLTFVQLVLWIGNLNLPLVDDISGYGLTATVCAAIALVR